MSTINNKGSEWAIWDLQVQTILDENYLQLKDYYKNIKTANPEKWDSFVDKVGGENKALLFDSKVYFNNETINKKERCINYIRTAFAFIEIFKPYLKLIGITDHNYYDDLLIDEFYNYAQTNNCKVICGVEINIGGIHLLVYFEIPPYQKNKFSEGIVSFLSNLGINNPKTNGVLTVSSNSLINDVIPEIRAQNGIYIYPHCNSNNGLFQDRTKTDRTHLSDIFNLKSRIILQSNSKDSIDKISEYIESQPLLFKSKPIFTIASDSRRLDEIGNPDKDKNFLWIKANPTFEGLKQIIYDPQSRIFIQEHEPVKPNNIIDNITLNIPSATTISVKQNEGVIKDEKFCFAGIKNTYYLSPYFNCFIGGRGTGKSTILNFLGQYSNNPVSSKEFWNKINPSFDTKDFEYFSFEGVELFEFIGQNEVESFATDTEAFTNAIYKRANLLNDEILSSYEKKLSKFLNSITSFKQIIEDLNKLMIDKELKEKDKKILETSIKITESSKYTEIVDKIKVSSRNKQLLEGWRTKIDELRLDIDILFKEHFPIPSEEKEKIIEANQQEGNIVQEYQIAFEKVKENIESVKRILNEKNFEKQKQDENELIHTISEQETELSELLKSAGLSEENILQIKSAPQKFVRINDDLSKINEKVKAKKTELSDYQKVLRELKEVRIDYENAIKKSVQPLISTLEQQSKGNSKKDVKNIGLNYFFDEQLSWKEIADEMYMYFSKRYKTTEKSVHVKNYITDNKNIFSTNLKEIKKQLSSETQDTEYLGFLKSVFDDNSNYQIFETIRDNHLNDVISYKRIQVLYDGKDIEQASFGQKCTAVMVILLLFGNYPLIIDEPEAHLDSSLIVNYLVPLIKQKKNNRQIIFATHNANFVINGDAEKIFILKNETGITEIIETTIEDLDNRNELLKLEGGKEAFRKRGEKLHI